MENNEIQKLEERLFQLNFHAMGNEGEVTILVRELRKELEIAKELQKQCEAKYKMIKKL